MAPLLKKKRRSARKARKSSRKKKRSAKKKKSSKKKKKSSKKKASKKKAAKVTTKVAKKAVTKVHDGGKKPAPAKGKQMSKTEVTQALEDMSGIKKAVCKKVYEGFLELVYHEMEKRKIFALAGVCKFVTKRRKARKAGKGTNPFTGEPCVIKARPACNVPRVRVLKALKDQIK